MRIIDLHTQKATTVSDRTAVALGFFDGVHLGHRTLFSVTREEAKKRGIASAVLTFSERGSRALKTGMLNISTEREKLLTFKELGLDYAILMDFDAVRDMSPEQFISELVLDRCRAEVAVCGYNFRFGKGAQGNADTLVSLMNEADAEAIVCPAFLIDGEPVSSTQIRECIANGNVRRASKLLGSPFSITAEVVSGKKLGRTIGLPTANQYIPDGIVKIKNGIYVTRTYVSDRCYYSITNVGVRPTVDVDGRPNCETYILDYEGDLYGSRIKVEYLDFIRDEMHFSGLDEMKAQIQKDIEEVRKWQKNGQS